MIYEYKCSFCGKIHDVEHGMNEAPKIKCNYCGTTCEKKITGGTGFILKGVGWYSTDYKNKTRKDVKKGRDSKNGSAEKD